MKVRAVPHGRGGIPRPLRRHAGSRAARCCLRHVVREQRLPTRVAEAFPEEDKAYILEAIAESETLYWQVSANLDEAVVVIEFVSDRRHSYVQIAFDQDTARPKNTTLLKVRSDIPPFHRL